MARGVWSDRFTQLSVVAYALGGAEAQDRVPTNRQSDRRPARREGDSTDWTEAKGEWRLAKYVGNGEVQRVAPKISPEEDERRKMTALSQLMGVQRATAMQAGKGLSRSQIEAVDPAAGFKAQLDRANNPDGQE